MRNTSQSAFNRLQHENSADEESQRDAQHQALQKMMQGTPMATAPTAPAGLPGVPPVAAVPPTAPLTPPGATQTGVPSPPQPHFAGIHAALKPMAGPTGNGSNPIKIAAAMPRKPFQRRV
jgi:hypothetical protein